jgi:type IV pilus assembly protein PilA
MSKQNGFTLIETMITVCIIGILASVAFSSYRTYVIRAEVSEAFNMATTLKPAIAEYYADTGKYLDTVSGKIGRVGKYIESVEVTDGVILVTFGGEAHPELRAIGHNTLGVTFGANDRGTIVFSCGYAKPPIEAADMAGDASKATTVPAKYLPGVCKS